MDTAPDCLSQTCLYKLHLSYGAKMVPFAGYSMPVQYPKGLVWEHNHTRNKAGLFDVSHMGQIRLTGKNAAAELEKLVPADILGLAPGRQRYTYFTNPEGGILDDIMVTNQGDAGLFLVVNAARKAHDLAWLQEHLQSPVEYLESRALLALQGPAAVIALTPLLPQIANMRFMDAATITWQSAEIWISRSGYTGEDGFEISLPESIANAFCGRLLENDHVTLVGLGARDSLRLEAGLCLYGHDINENTSPAEAGLDWAIQKIRRTKGTRAGGFPGDTRILQELGCLPARIRCGLLPDGRGAMREGTPLFALPDDDAPIGHITSGSFGPSVERSIAMGYLPAKLAVKGTRVWGEVRGKRIGAEVSQLPFLTHKYYRKTNA
jgi:aminomethyltransferase